MFFKLARKNVTRSLKDYSVYFLTLTLGVSLFYVFNSLEGQWAMQMLAKSAHYMVESILIFMNIFSAFVSVVLACLVLYRGTGLSWATDIWKKWDAWHYVGLAELGYTGYWEDGRPLFLVFFPLYPWLVRLVCPLTGHNTMAAGLMVAFLCYSAGCVYLYRLAAWELGKGAARRTGLFLSLFPYAFFFGGVMTEGLFLLTTAAALWHIRRHRWWRAGMWGVLAAMTRMHGLLLIGAASGIGRESGEI